MLTVNASEVFRRCDAFELSTCIRINRWSQRQAVRQLFATISWLGNGIFWYVLILSLPFIYADPGLRLTLQFSVTGFIGVRLYKWMKQRWVRERPYISHLGIRAGVAPLDRYSFPSGHTLHAVCFAILFSVYVPALAWVVMPFALLVALSRVVLGMHYPSDVAVGAALGATLAGISINLAGMA